MYEARQLGEPFNASEIIDDLSADGYMQTKYGKGFIQNLRLIVSKSLKRKALTDLGNPEKPVSDKKKMPQQESTSKRKPSTKSVNAQSKNKDLSTLQPCIQADFASSEKSISNTTSGQTFAKKSRKTSGSSKRASKQNLEEEEGLRINPVGNNVGPKMTPQSI